MADQSNEMVERVARALAKEDLPQVTAPDLWKEFTDLACAAIEAMRRPVGEIHVPSDIEQYGANHNIPNFAAATYRSGYIDGHRAALSHDEVKGPG